MFYRPPSWSCCRLPIRFGRCYGRRSLHATVEKREWVFLLVSSNPDLLDWLMPGSTAVFFFGTAAGKHFLLLMPATAWRLRREEIVWSRDFSGPFVFRLVEKSAVHV